MLRLLRRTLLYQRASEACDAYRALRRAEHRSALKLKRAAVRSRVMYELQRTQIEQAVFKMETARAAVRVQSAQEVASAHGKRRDLLREALGARGESIPGLSSSSSASSGATSSEEPANLGADAFKERMVTRVESLLPPAEETGPGRRIATEILRDSVSKVPLADEQGRADMSVKLIAGVAKQAGVGWEEMEQLMEVVEKDAEKREELRKVVREAMFDGEQRSQRIQNEAQGLGRSVTS